MSKSYSDTNLLLSIPILLFFTLGITQIPVFAQANQQNSTELSYQECQNKIGIEMQKATESINHTKATFLALSSSEFQSKTNGYHYTFTNVFTNMTMNAATCDDVQLKDVLVEFSLLNETGGLIKYLDVGEDPTLTKITLVEYVNVAQTDNSHLPSPPALLLPLQQYKSGIAAQDVTCKEGLQLVIKAKDNSPACVQSSTAAKLVTLGWAKSQENNGVLVTLAEGQREGPLLVQKILPDGVQGLDFREYPLATNVGYPITLHIGDSASNGCTVELTLVKISNGTATFLKKEYQNRPCPICLSENTVIDTPNGAVNVTDLKVGMMIFTQDSSGHKQTGIILKTGRTLAPQNHIMVHVVLADKRELYVSPNHPTADGRLFGNLLAGDILDGSKVKNAEQVPYNGTYTYDILPSGQTGFYWADGILVASTLK